MSKSEEHKIQVGIANYLRENLRKGSIFFAVPNGGTRKMTKVAGGKSIPLEAIRLKKEGVTAGVADVLVISDIEPRIVALETKTEKGKQSTSQVWWQAEAEKAGVAYHIVRSVGDVKHIIETCGLKKAQKTLTDGAQTDIDEWLNGDSNALPIDAPLE